MKHYDEMIQKALHIQKATSGKGGREVLMHGHTKSQTKNAHIQKTAARGDPCDICSLAQNKRCSANANERCKDEKDIIYSALKF